MNTFQDLDEATRCTFKTLRGWLTGREAGFLFSTAKQCPQSTAIVEIGSAYGKSTICLARGAKAGCGAKVFSIDPHIGGNYDEFIKNIEISQLHDVVCPVRKTSEDAILNWTHPISLLFIDGNHEYSFVKQDFLLWFPYVVNGGVIAFHDSTSSVTNMLLGYPGPKKVVDKYLFKSKEVSQIGLVDTITFAQKGKSDSWSDDVAKRLVRLRKVVPDILLGLNHNLPKVLPAPLRKKLKVLVYGTPGQS